MIADLFCRLIKYPKNRSNHLRLNRDRDESCMYSQMILKLSIGALLLKLHTVRLRSAGDQRLINFNATELVQSLNGL